MKRITILFLIAALMLPHCAPTIAAIDINISPVTQTNSIGEIGGYLSGNVQTIKHLYEDRLFTSQNGGKGFAAENCNNLIDKFKGLDSTVVGTDYVANGPDRRIINRDGSITWIQDKYHSTASGSVNDAFEGANGKYKYYVDDKPMQLEVPADQYEEAVELMREKIKKKLVDHVTDPDEAESLVRKGHLTYKQAVNLTKAGNIDSLIYDASTGAISSACSAGISFVIDYACCLLNGVDASVALKDASLNGLKTGGIVFATHIISGQIAKTGAINAFVPTAEAITKVFGDDACRAILARVGIDATEMASKTITSNVAKIISKELIADSVLVILLTGADVVELFRGRISKEELLKNLTVTIIGLAAGTAGGIGGGALGTLIAPGLGTAIGGVVGSTVVGGAAGILSDLVISKFYESDAEEMFKIISEEFLVLSEEYLISEDDGKKITEKLKDKLTGDTLKDMYAFKDRNQFARNLIEPLFVSQIKERVNVETPSEEEIRLCYKEAMHGIVFIH